MSRYTLLVLVGVLSFATLSSRPGNEAPVSGPSVELNWDILQKALIWVDGVPLLPPYTVEIVGDSAVVVNSVPVKTIPTHPRQRPPRTASELLHDRAYEAMFAAIRAGVPDSLIAAVGCSVYAAADTSLCLSAEVGPGGTAILVTARRRGHLYYDRNLVPSHDTLEGAKRPKPSPMDRLTELQRSIDVLIGRRSFQFFNHNGSHTETIPRSFEQRVYQDIIAAASQRLFDEKKWRDLSTGPHTLDWVTAREISEHATWTGR